MGGGGQSVPIFRDKKLVISPTLADTALMLLPLRAIELRLLLIFDNRPYWNPWVDRFGVLLDSLVPCQS